MVWCSQKRFCELWSALSLPSPTTLLSLSLRTLRIQKTFNSHSRKKKLRAPSPTSRSAQRSFSPLIFAGTPMRTRCDMCRDVCERRRRGVTVMSRMCNQKHFLDRAPAPCHVRARPDRPQQDQRMVLGMGCAPSARLRRQRRAHTHPTAPRTPTIPPRATAAYAETWS